MDADKREVFVLAEFEEWPRPEIAAALGLELETVYGKLRAARAQFDRALQRHRAADATRDVVADALSLPA